MGRGSVILAEQTRLGPESSLTEMWCDRGESALAYAARAAFFFKNLAIFEKRVEKVVQVKMGAFWP